MPAAVAEPVRAPAADAADRARTSPLGGDGRAALAAAGLAAVFAVAWAAQRSGALHTSIGSPLARADGALGVLLVLGAAWAAVRAVGRALDGDGPTPLRPHLTLLLRAVLVPWWVVVTVAVFAYPTATGEVVPSDAAAPGWAEVVREWLLLRPLGRTTPVDQWPFTSSGRLGHAWVLTTAVVTWLLLPVAERLLRRAAAARRAPVELVAAAGGGALALAGLVLRVGLAALEADPRASGLHRVVRISPLGQLDLVGAGLALGALVAAAARGGGPLAGRTAAIRASAPRLGAVVALALVAGAANPIVRSTLDTGGVAATVVGRAGLLAVGAAVALWALLPGARPAHPAARRAAALAGTAWLPGLLAVPLVAQLWATRAGGAPGTQRIGPLVVVTVLGSAAAGLALGAALRWAFGTDLRRRLPPFTARLATVTGAALAWRLLTLVSLNRANPGGGDPYYYHHQANMLADRVGYSEPFRWVEQGLAVPSAIHPPLLSTWLSLASWAGARTFLAHKTMTALLGVGAVVVAALVARRLAGDRAALITAVAVAAYPNLWVIDGALWPEGAYTTLVALAVLAAYRWWERPDLRRAALWGAVVAVAALARGEALFLYPLLVAPVVLARRGIGLGHKVRAGLVAGLCGLALLVPWSVRNLAAFDQPVLLSTNSDEVLYYANCPDSYGLDDPATPEVEGGQLGYWSFNCQERERDRAGQPVRDAEEAALYRECLGELWSPELEGVVPGEPPGNEAQKARYWRCLAVDYAREHADRLPVVVAARIGRELDVYNPGDSIKALQFEGRPRGVAVVGQRAWWVLAPLGVAGWLVLRRRRVLVLPLVSLGAMVLATTVYAYGAVRFRTPLELALLVGLGVLGDHLWTRWRARRREATP